MFLTRDTTTPLQQQIADVLTQEINAGAFEPSGKLPSEADLCRRFEVSRVTVRLALDKLSGVGAVERKQGKGTYVAGKQVRHGLDQLRSFHESLLLQGLKADMRLLSRQLIAVPERMRALAGAEDGHCVLLERLHLVDGAPIALGRNYLTPAVAGVDAGRVARQPAYSMLADLTGLQVVRADIAIQVGYADDAVAAALEVAPGSALLLMERSSYFADGRCCDVSQFHIRPERYAFVIKSHFSGGTL